MDRHPSRHEAARVVRVPADRLFDVIDWLVASDVPATEAVAFAWLFQQTDYTFDTLCEINLRSLGAETCRDDPRTWRRWLDGLESRGLIEIQATTSGRSSIDLVAVRNPVDELPGEIVDDKPTRGQLTLEFDDAGGLVIHRRNETRRSPAAEASADSIVEIVATLLSAGLRAEHAIAFLWLWRETGYTGGRIAVSTRELAAAVRISVGRGSARLVTLAQRGLVAIVDRPHKRPTVVDVLDPRAVLSDVVAVYRSRREQLVLGLARSNPSTRRPAAAPSDAPVLRVARSNPNTRPSSLTNGANQAGSASRPSPSTGTKNQEGTASSNPKAKPTQNPNGEPVDRLFAHLADELGDEWASIESDYVIEFEQHAIAFVASSQFMFDRFESRLGTRLQTIVHQIDPRLHVVGRLDDQVAHPRPIEFTRAPTPTAFDLAIADRGEAWRAWSQRIVAAVEKCRQPGEATLGRWIADDTAQAIVRGDIDAEAVDLVLADMERKHSRGTLANAGGYVHTRFKKIFAGNRIKWRSSK